MKNMILGIDISKDSFDVTLLSSEGMLFENLENLEHRKFVNRLKGFVELVNWLHEHDVIELHACMEATSTYGHALAEYLYYCGFRVSVVNPSRITNFRKSELGRTKTDKNDSQVIARFCRAMNPDLWEPLKMEEKKLKALNNRLRDLETMRQQEKNRLKTPGLDEDVVDSIEDHIEILDEQIRGILDQMKNLTSSDEEMKRIKELICSIPGIGEKTAVCLIGIIINFDKFQSARQLAAWAGIPPFQRQSGSSLKGRSYMSKIGRSDIRRIMYMPAMSAMRSNPVIINQAARLREKGLTGKQIVVAAMHKLIRIIYGVVSNNHKFDLVSYSQID